jgi:nucleotide-binding universal stress UspA family protein
MRILVPLDGSEFSLAAVPFAGQLSRATNADVVFIAVGELPESGNDALRIRTELHERIQRARAMLDGNITVHALVEMNDNPAAVIVQAARTQAIDLVVMSTHGRTGLARVLQGSVASAVVRDSPVPVTLVRPDVEAQENAPEQPHAAGS